MKKELIAVHLTLGFAAHIGLTFRQSSTFFVPAIQEHIEIRSHLFMEFENTSVNASAV
jgi:hypothetical protein